MKSNEITLAGQLIAKMALSLSWPIDGPRTWSLNILDLLLTVCQQLFMLRCATIGQQSKFSIFTEPQAQDIDLQIVNIQIQLHAAIFQMKPTQGHRNQGT